MASLLQPRHDISMRPSGDKEEDPFDIDDFCEKYVGTDAFQFSDTTVDPSSSDDLAHLFELPSSNGNDPIETSPMPNWDASSEDAWHKALQNLKQNPASPAVRDSSLSIYPESHGKGALSDPELFSFDDLFDLDTSPRVPYSSPPSPTPQVLRHKKAVSDLKNPIHRVVSTGVQKSAKKSAPSAKMMRPNQYRPTHLDLWARKIESSGDGFNLQLRTHSLPQTPPPSTKLVQDENTTGFFPSTQPYANTISPLPTTEDNTINLSNPPYQLTPLSSPSIDVSSRNGTGNPFQFSNDNMATAYISSQIHNNGLSALQTPPASARMPMTTWGPATPASLDFSFATSPEFQAAKQQGWWGGPNGAAGAPQPTTPSYQTSPAHGRSQSRSHSQSMSFSTASMAGLGISCDANSFSFNDMGGSNVSSAHGSSDFSASSFDMGAYTTTYAPLPQNTQTIEIGTTPPSRSPSLSPQPRLVRQRRAVTHTPRTASHSSHRARKSSGSSAGGQRTASVGFVNFTPDDSRKILTGVAPSGSSKTKARREKEALERRRRLSQAAVKVVMEAGGDLSKLEEEGLLITTED